ncbi:MAG: ATP-binding protein, partial [Bacteroidales bacterium]|nr:ATP-binding protein [Bacteroidales bacterium]
CDLYYFGDKTSEIDFVVCKGNQVQLLVQVSYDISAPKTRKRELSGFVNGVRQTGCRNCLLITDHEYGTETLPDGTQVNILPAYDYFLDR